MHSNFGMQTQFVSSSAIKQVYWKEALLHKFAGLHRPPEVEEDC